MGKNCGVGKPLQKKQTQTHATQVQEWTHENAKHIKHTQERKRVKTGIPRRE